MAARTIRGRKRVTLITNLLIGSRTALIIHSSRCSPDKRYPALKRGAKFGRPSGAARWTPLEVNPLIAAVNRCATQKQEQNRVSPRRRRVGHINVRSITPVCLSTLTETTGCATSSAFRGVALTAIAGQNLSSPFGGARRPRFGRPYGTWVAMALHPALKRGAKFGRPSGAAWWTPLHASESDAACFRRPQCEQDVLRKKYPPGRRARSGTRGRCPSEARARKRNGRERRPCARA